MAAIPSAGASVLNELAGMPAEESVAGVFAEQSNEDWARQVATVVGDDLTAAEADCIDAGARAGLFDDPSLWGSAIAGDLAALRPLGDRVAQDCGVAPVRLAPIIARALAQWGDPRVGD